MQNLESICKEAEKKLEIIKLCSLPLSHSQDINDILRNSDPNNCKPFSIFDKLEELYREECFRDFENSTGVKSNSFLLEKLVTREGLNTLILNLYPEKNEYTFSLRMGSIIDDINIGNNIDKSSNALNDDNTMKMQWQPDDELLRCIDNEELPSILTDLFEEEYPELFYSGCIIVEVRDYQQVNSQVTCETHHVLLKPTVQSLLADLNSIIENTCQEWTEYDKLLLESELTNATNPKLCLDPTPSLCILTNKVQHQRNLFNTYPLKRCAQRFSLVNRKRKLDQNSPNTGFELYDFITKKRMKSANSLSKSKQPRMVLPAPSLENDKQLIVPQDVNTTKFRSYVGPRETKNCMPVLIEEYILDTERQCERDKHKIYHLHIKLSILQRPFNSEYLGELYLDVDYEVGKNNGCSSRFTLGSRSYVDKFIRQFTDMLTKKGRNPMKIVKMIPGQEPKHINLPRMNDKAVEAAQQAQVHAAQQSIQAVQLQPTINQQLQFQQNQLQQQHPQILTGPSSMLQNGTGAPNVVLVQQANQTTVQNVPNNTAALPILQAQLQSNSQPKLDPRHTANPEITALVASFINEAQQIEQEQAAAAAAAAAAQQQQQQQHQQQQHQQQQQHHHQQQQTSNANAAILSLLNTSPVNSVNSATSAAVANAITNTNPTLLNTQQTVQTLNQKMLAARKMTLTNVPRVLNHSNVITVNNTGTSTQQQVRISALASQLATPPVNVIIATANSSQQPTHGQTFTLTTVAAAAGFPTQVNYTTNQIKQPRLMGVRGVTNKGSGTEGGTQTVSGLSALLVNTPSADHPIPGANSASALLERLTASSSAVSSADNNSTQFTKTIPVQLSKNSSVIAPLSSPTVHTLNLTPFPGIQNVQVQIPRLASPLNASSSTGIQTHPTSLIFSVAVTTATTTCTSTTQQGNSIASTLGSNAVVITNNTAPGSTSPALPLPIAQLVASGVKGLTHQGIRVSSPNTVSTALAQATGKSVQLVGALPRNAQISGVKQQLAASRLLPTQRLTNTAIKMTTTNATSAQVGNVTLGSTGMNLAASNSVVTLSAPQQQHLQLTLQKQNQFQQFHGHNLTQQQLQTCLNQQQQKTISPAAVATKHHRRSNAADPNK